jgi:sugar phosphate isomerase/epimerase
MIGAVADAEAVLASSRSFLVIDWPTRDVPDTLALAGYEVVVHGGPGPNDYVAYTVAPAAGAGGATVVKRPVGAPPGRADVVWTYRPLAELPEAVRAAQACGAGTVWVHSGLAEGGAREPAGCWLPPGAADAARALVEGAGLAYLDQPSVADAVRRRAGRGEATRSAHQTRGT